MLPYKQQIVNKCLQRRMVMKENAKVSLSNAEWRVMDLLWDKNPMTIAQMVQHFEGITDWDRHVIIMMLKRMEAKGAVSYHTVGRAKQYYPLVDKNEACVQETEDFLDRVYKGSLGLMLTTMVQQEKISSNELDELRKILNGGEEDV